MTALQNRPAFVPFERSEIDQSIPERFDRQVKAHPERPAVGAGHITWNYRRLNEEANRIAHALLSLDTSSADPAAMMLDQSPLNVAAVLGVLKAGKIYTPLDPTLPGPALREMLRRSGARALITDGHNASRAFEVAQSDTVVLDLNGIDESRVDNPEISIPPDATAYLFFTSGSTGTPKGVFDSHRNVLHNVMRYTNSLRIDVHDRLSLLQRPSFSGSVSSQFGALLNGSALFPFDTTGDSLARLADWIVESEITIYHSVPSLFRLAASQGVTFPTLRIVRLEGDRAAARDVEVFNRCCTPGSLLVNGLGATECGLVRQFFVPHGERAPAGTLPLGHEVQDMEVRIVATDRSDQPPGEPGEIAVRSRFLARGYWGDPERTEARFLRDAPDPTLRSYLTGDLGRLARDGCLEYLGRDDSRPRIRGKYVDLVEVESALIQLGLFDAAVVRAWEHPSGETELAAYLVWREGTEKIAPGDLRRRLATSLMDVAVPKAFIDLKRLPLSVNGKVDRRALPPPRVGHGQRIEFQEPRTDDERRVAEIWETILGTAPIARHDDFFDLGGDSLSAARIAAQLAREFGAPMVPSSIFEHPTVCQLAQAVRHKRCAGTRANAGRLISLRRGGPGIPIFFFPGAAGNVVTLRNLAERLGPSHPVYAFEMGRPDAANPTSAAMERLAKRFIDHAREVQPTGPYALCGYSWGATLAFEAAQQLTASGATVALLGILDEPAPAGPTLKLGLRLAALDWSSRLRKVTRFALARIANLGGRLLHAANPGQAPVVDHDRRALARSAERSYRPAQYPGALTLFLASMEGTLKRSDAAIDLGWSRFVSNGVAVERVPGDHDTLLSEPHVTTLAARLSDCANRGSAAAVRAVGEGTHQ